MSADTSAPRKIEIDRDGRKWTGSYRMIADNEIEVHSAYGSHKAFAHDMPALAAERETYLDGFARMVLVEMIDRHLGLR